MWSYSQEALRVHVSNLHNGQCCPLLSGTTSPLGWALLSSLESGLPLKDCVYSCMDSAAIRVLSNGASRAEIKLALHAFFPSFSASFPIPPQAPGLCNRYVS